MALFNLPGFEPITNIFNCHFRFTMAFKLALLVASMAVAAQASNTLWACGKFNLI
jgi:hypothetical protein